MRSNCPQTARWLHRVGDMRFPAALAAVLACACIPAQAQTIIHVGGEGTIGDTTLPTVSEGSKLVAKLQKDGAHWTAAGGEGIVYSHLTSPTLTVPTGGPVTLKFTHRYFLEQNWDGGALYVTVNGAGPTYVDASAFTTNGYTSTGMIGSVYTGGEQTFTGKSTGYDVPTLIESVVSLGTLTAGDTVSFEFRGGWDDATVEAAPNWEIGTVAVRDSANTALLNVDFINGPAGFSVVSDGALAGPFVYLAQKHQFEINGDTLAADRYVPNTPGANTIIDLNDADLGVVLLAGTLNVGDSFTLFGLSGGTTLRGNYNSITLPGGVLWDLSQLTVTGKIICKAVGLGLRVSGYDSTYGPSYLNPIANLMAVTPSGTGIQTADINYGNVLSLPGITGTEYFSVLWEGWLNVTVDGTGDYTFGTASDDGSVLYADLNDDGVFDPATELVVSNNKDQGTTVVTGTVELTMPSVHIVIGYYQGGGGYSMAARFNKGSALGWNDLQAINGRSGHFTLTNPFAASVAKITSFSPASVIGQPVGNAADIAWTVRFGTTNLSRLAPAFTLSAGAKCYDKTPTNPTAVEIFSGTHRDFSGAPVHYFVKSSDGLVINDYTVTVAVAPSVEHIIIANWTFNDGTGADSSGNGHNLGGQSGPVIASPATGWGPSPNCTSHGPGARDGFESWPDLSGAGMPTDDFTLGMYVQGNNPPYSGSGSSLFATTGSSGNGLWIGTRAIGGIDSWEVIVSGTTLATFPVTPGTVQHIEVARAAGVWSVMLDGVVRDVPVSTASFSWGSCHVGVNSGGGSGYSGLFGDITITSGLVVPVPGAKIVTFGPGATIGTVAANAATIAWSYPHGANKSDLAPTFTLSAGAKCYDKNPLTNPTAVELASGAHRNFSGGAVHYFVKSGDYVDLVNDYAVTATETPVSEACQMLTFGIPGYPATIDQVTKTIAWKVPYGSLASLSAQYTVSALATGNPLSGSAQNFSAPPHQVTYRVTAEYTNVWQNYVVTATEMPRPPGDTSVGPVCWYDAGNGVTNTGGAVSAWNDRSGFEHLAARGGGTITLVANQLKNSLPAVQLRGGGTYLSCAGTNFTKEQYVVVRSPNATWNGSGSFLGRQGTGNSGARSSSYNLFSGQTGFWDDQLPSAVSKNGIAVSSGAGTMGRGGFQLGPITEYMLLKITVNTNANAANLAQYPFYEIGRNDNLGTMDFDVAEIIGYSSALSTADEAKVGSYLAAKYGLFTAYPDLTPQALIGSFALVGKPASINQSARTISLIVPSGTVLAGLASTFTLSPGAKCYPTATSAVEIVSGTTTLDFTNPVHYFVKSSDGAITNDYIVTVTIGPSSTVADLDVTTPGGGAEILNGGTLVEANHFGQTGLISPVTVNGVEFGTSWAHMTSGWNTGGQWTDADSQSLVLSLGGGDGGFQDLMRSYIWTGASSTRIDVPGLVTGHTYRLQLISSSPRGGNITLEGYAFGPLAPNSIPPKVFSFTWKAADTTANVEIIRQAGNYGGQDSEILFNGYALHDVTPASDMAEILTFYIPGSLSTSIDQGTRTIRVHMSPGTVMSALFPTYTLSGTATCVPTSPPSVGIDFSKGPVLYTVTSSGAPAIKTTYTVTVVTYISGFEETIFDDPAGNAQNDIEGYRKRALSIGASDAQGILTGIFSYPNDAAFDTRAAELGAVGFNSESFAALWITGFRPDEAGAWGFRFDNVDDDVSFWIDMDGNGVFEIGNRFYYRGCCAASGDQYTPSVMAGTTYLFGIPMRDSGGGGILLNMQFKRPSGDWTTINPSDPAQDGLWRITPQAWMTSFGANVAGSSAAIGAVVGNKISIAWTVAYSMTPAEIAALAPEYTLSTNATCNQPNGGIPTPNFGTGPVDYTVISSDGSITNVYTVTVTKTPTPVGYMALVLATDPTVYWPLHEPAGPIAFDYTGANNAAYSGSGVTYGVPGPVGSVAASLDGVAGTKIVAPYSAALNPSGPFTVECWINPANTTSGSRVLVIDMINGQNLANTGDRSGWAFRQSGATLQFLIGDDSIPNGGYSLTATTPAVLTAGTWQHVLATYDSATTNVSIWVNGSSVLSQTGPKQLFPNFAAPTMIGDRGYGGWIYNGSIAHVALYSRALTAQEIQSHAQNAPILQVGQSGGKVVLTWVPGGGGLQAAPVVTGPYTNVPAATSPWPITPSAGSGFWRVKF